MSSKNLDPQGKPWRLTTAVAEIRKDVDANLETHYLAKRGPRRWLQLIGIRFGGPEVRRQFVDRLVDHLVYRATGHHVSELGEDGRPKR